MSPNEPILKAFSAGKYLDASEAYVGTVNLPGDGLDSLLPGRATISKTLQGPGVYIVTNGEEYRETTSVAYLQVNPELFWTPADSFNASKILNAIKIKSKLFSFGYFIGRYNLTRIVNSRNETYTQVGKVHIDKSFKNLVYADENQKVHEASSTFEVLTCKRADFFTSSLDDDDNADHIQESEKCISDMDDADKSSFDLKTMRYAFLEIHIAMTIRYENTKCKKLFTLLSNIMEKACVKKGDVMFY